MNDSGNPMDLYESIVYALRKRITVQQFADLFVAEFKAKANGKANGKNHPKGSFILPGEGESYDLSVKTIFWDGPICLYYIALEKCGAGDQHYFLFNCGIFFRRKYPDGWEKALEWVNFNVLRPVGDVQKLQDMIKDFKNKGERPYEYTCKNPPICNRCHASVCKMRPYGVGAGNGVDFLDLALTVINSKPQTFFAMPERIACTAGELQHLKAFRVKCLEYSSSFPDMMSQANWDKIVRSSLENATYVDPPDVVKTDAKELRMMEEFLGLHIMGGVRRNFGEFMTGKWGDPVRIREDEKRIYFKHKKLLTRIRLMRGAREEEMMTSYIANKCMEHRQGPGIRDWFRYSYSISWDVFDDDVLTRWFTPEEKEQGDAG